MDVILREDIEKLGTQHLSAARYCPDAFCQNVLELAVIGGGTVDDRDAADRQADVPVRIFRHEKACIERVQLLHESSPPFTPGTSSSIRCHPQQEVAARLNRVNNWSRLCGNVVQSENF